jgi:aromatic-L-amino-acid decarboxylase
MTGPGGPEPAYLADASLADREDVLRDLTQYLATAWESFARPRPEEPHPDPDLVARLGTGLPAEPSELHAALSDAVRVLDASYSPSRPLFVAYVGSSGLHTGVLASALSAAYDANLAVSAGAADLLDRQALRWLAEFVGYPVAEGHFTSGGQTSNLTALLAAREAALPGSRENGVDGARATVYCSEEAHHSIVRAIEAAGLGSRALRRIPLDSMRRMSAEALSSAIAKDRAAGFTPVAVVATAGTTLTGAVDPMAAIGEVCAREGVWLHVDGAYGLPAAATATAGHWFAGLALADSVTVDAHKWLGLPKSCSAVLLRRPGALRAAFGHEERYMLHEGDVANPVDSTFEYSRPFRSLRLWLSLRVHGADQFRAWLEGSLHLAQLLSSAVQEASDFELLHEPMLSTVCFRHVVPGLSEEELNSHNDALARAMQADGRVFIAPADVDGRTCLRACFVNFRTTPADVRFLLEVARELGERS